MSQPEVAPPVPSPKSTLEDVTVSWSIDIVTAYECKKSPKIESHHSWEIKFNLIKEENLLVSLGLVSYHKSSDSHCRSAPFHSDVDCKIFVNDVQKAVKIERDHRFTLGTTSTFSWPTSTILELAPGTPPQNLRAEFTVNLRIYRSSKVGGKCPRPHFDFGGLVADHQDEDLKIITKSGTIVGAYRLLLASRATRFARLLNSKEDNQLEVAAPSSIVAKMLEFLYTGALDVNPLGDIVQLFEIADKFGIEDLKEECEAEIKVSLSLDKIVELLQLVRDANLVRVKPLLIQFINANKNKLKKNKEYKELVKANPELLNEVDSDDEADEEKEDEEEADTEPEDVEMSED